MCVYESIGMKCDYCWQDELDNVEYGSDVDKTQLSLDMLRRLKQRTQDIHPEVQVCCSFKVLLITRD